VTASTNVISFPDNTDFDSFGPSSWATAYKACMTRLPLPAGNAATRQSIREQCPATPGVYGMIGVDQQLIYVGQSKSLRHRLLSYFTGEPASAKVGRIVEEAKSLVWERSGHELTALLRELELIRRWQPRLNVRGNPTRTRQAYVCIGRGPAAHAYLSIKPSISAKHTFGPVPAGRQYRRRACRLNDCFGLRDCRRPSEVLFSDQLGLFSEEHEAKCIRGAVGTCLAPCATACSRAEYDDRIVAAVEFLSGRAATVLHRIEKEMKSAAEGQQFELAARLRDAHEDLARLSASLQRLREARRHTFVYPVLGLVGKENWYLIREGQIMGVERAPHTERASAHCLKALDVVFPQNGCLPLPVAPEHLDMALLLARWFREHPEELEAVLSAEEARDLCNSRSGG